MASIDIKGLTAEQCQALTGVQSGDIVLIEWYPKRDESDSETESDPTGFTTPQIVREGEGAEGVEEGSTEEATGGDEVAEANDSGTGEGMSPQ